VRTTSAAPVARPIAGLASAANITADISNRFIETSVFSTFIMARRPFRRA
jgi:hypothetical protein